MAGMTSHKSLFFIFQFLLLAPAFSRVQILLKLAFIPADEMGANSKKSKAGKEGKT
jgi:hypothetical protein